MANKKVTLADIAAEYKANNGQVDYMKQKTTKKVTLADIAKASGASRFSNLTANSNQRVTESVAGSELVNRWQPTQSEREAHIALLENRLKEEESKLVDADRARYAAIRSGADAKQAEADYMAGLEKYNKNKASLESQLSAAYAGTAAAKHKESLQAYQNYFNDPDFDAVASAGAKKSYTAYEMSPMLKEQSSSYSGKDADRTALMLERNNTAFDQMTDDEIDLYHYLRAKEGDKSADRFLDFLEESVNARAGSGQAKAIAGIESPLLRTAATGAHSLYAGADSFITGAKQLLSEDAVATPKSAFAASEIDESLADVGPQIFGKSLGQYAYGAGQTVGAMAPAIGLSAIAGAVGAPSAVASAIGAGAMGLSSAGNTYKDLISQGVTKSKAKGTAALTGAAEAATQYVLGGIGKLGGITDDLLLAKARAINKAVGRVAATGAIKIGSEITEEELQLFLQPAIESLMLDTGTYDMPTFEEMAQTAITTALSTGALEGRSIASSAKAQTQDARKGLQGSPATIPAVSEGSNATEAKTPQNGSESDSGDIMMREAERLFGQKNNAAQAGTESTVINDDPAQHTPQEQAVIEAYKRSSDDKLRGFIVRVRSLVSNDYRNKIRAEIETSTNRAAEKASALTGIDTAGYKTIIKGNSIMHIDRRHGAQGEADHSMANLDDFSRIGFVLDNFTDAEIVAAADVDEETAKLSREWMNSDNTHAAMVRFSMPVNGTYYIVEAVPSSNAKVMAVVSAYMEKGAKKGNPPQSSAEHAADTSGRPPQLTPEAPHEILENSKYTVAQKKDVVKANDGLGAADAGFTTPDSRSEDRTSRMAETTMGYNAVEGEATGLDAEQYAQLLRYKTLTEKMATQQADDMLYVQQNGQRKFIRDVDEAAYQDIVSWLSMAPAWDAPMTDAAHMIRNELKGRSVNGDITQEEYVAWLETMREHATASGQGVQAHAKWSRTDNRGGASTELDARKALENSKLPIEEQARIFRQIVQWDMEVEAVKPGDTASLKAIIMDAARERGVVNGLFGKELAKLAESALDVLTFDQLKQFAYSSTAALANDSTPANAGRKMKTIQILNMLSKPTTPARNLTGNTTFYGLDALAMNGASLIDMAVAKLTGTRSIAAEGLPDMRAAAKALQMAVAEITLDVDMGGETTRYGTGSSRTFKMGGTGVFNTNTAADKFVERTLSSLERNLNYLLVATDEFYKGAARATEGKTQALIDEGKIKTTDKEYAKKQADELAKVRTFQDNSKLSAIVQDLHDLGNLIGFGDSGKTIKGRTVHSFGVGDFVAPFARVAGNLVSRGIEYSPLNAVKGTVEIANQVAAAASGKEVDAAKQAKGVSGVARGMTGTAVAYGFMLLVKAGLMRQAEDERDKDVAALNQSEGVRGTQLNLSAAQRAINGEGAEWRYGDTLVDLSSIEPLNLLMNLGAEMAKEPKNPLISAFNGTLTSISNAAAELPVLENVGEFVKDVTYYKTDWKEAAGEMLANAAISSVVPNILSGVATGLDDRPRNVYTGDDLWDYIQDSFKSRIPGLRETLPGNTNSLGEEKTYQGSQDSLLASLLSPVGINAYMQGDVSTELERVREATGGDTSFYPESTIPGELSHENKKMELSYDQRQKFQSVRGNTHSATVEKMKSTKAYKNASATEQAALLNRCKDYAYQIAKASVMGNDTLESWALNAKNAPREFGMSTAEYLTLYEEHLDIRDIEAEEDKDGDPINGSRKEKVIDYINKLDMTPTEKDWLFLMDYKSKDERTNEKNLRKLPWNQ